MLYLGIGVTHHGNKEIEQQDHKQSNEEEPVKFSLLNPYQNI